VHHAGHVLRAALQGCNQGLDFFGGFLRALGQTAHFIGNHGKATACVTGTGRFNGGVEGQQVGLFGHSLDHVHHAADLVAFLLQHGHGFSRTADFYRQTLDLINRLVDHGVAFAGFIVCRGRRLRGLFGVTCDFLHGGGHFMHRSGYLIGLDLLAVDPGAGLLGDGRQLFGSTGDLADTVANTADQLTQGCAHARNTLLQHAQFIATGHPQVL